MPQYAPTQTRWLAAQKLALVLYLLGAVFIFALAAVAPGPLYIVGLILNPPAAAMFMLPPLLALALLVIAALGLVTKSSAAFVMATGVAVALAGVIAFVPAAAMPLAMSASALHLIPTTVERNNFPLEVREDWARPLDDEEALAWSPDGAKLVVVGSSIDVWTVSGTQLSRVAKPANAPPLEWSNFCAPELVDGTRTVVSEYHDAYEVDDDLALLDTATGVSRPVQGPFPGQGDRNAVQCIAVSPDQRRVALAMQFEPSTGPNIIVVDARTWKPERQFVGPRVPTALSFLPDSRTLLVGNPGGEVTVIDTAGGSEPRNIAPTGYASAIAGSPDGSLILTDTVVVRASDGTRLGAAPISGDVLAAAWDPRGRFVALLAKGGHLVLWRPASIDPSYAKINLPDSGRIALSPDGSHIAAATDHELLMFSIH